MKEKITRFVKQEAVLCAALILSSVSMLLVPPDGEYINYIDFRTLFCSVSWALCPGFRRPGCSSW